MEGVSPAAQEARPRTPRSILFMCRMNAVRSPMAEAIARSVLPAGTYVASAGVRPGERDPFVDAVLGEVGLSLGRHAPHSLDELEDDYFDLIVTLAPEAHHAALELTRSMAVDVMYWPTPDPTVATGTREQILSSYRDVREFLKALIEKRLKGPG
ncbi:low molecular weight phosphatase family protein [Shinella sp. PSBB067]|uniref:arsenate-mycothiol transferase ArsC n=1 Tax=unclassified Shinella TaxID=2643062 RepID=UPI0009291021|nr:MULTISPECIES: low molecular weight phosphatase family protein [unclassified Shinella]MBN9056566.1 low molecular weight phosphatase family protein [Hyphomicrobiales bacterium]OJV02521.1 MAG: protein-tyrosine-phosphatase [Shinella sp. 65-6]QRI63566.1 low molecular weight phosphatase family protein [Shinella sp. PSBB067]